MGRKMILITCLFASGRCLFSYKERDLVPLCDVSQHQEEYMGKSIAVQGVLISFEHGAFLHAYPNCGTPDLAAIRIESGGNVSWSDYFQAGGSKGVGLMVILKGRVVISKRTHHPAFAVSSISYVKDAPCRTFEFKQEGRNLVLGCSPPKQKPHR